MEKIRQAEEKAKSKSIGLVDSAPSTTVVKANGQKKNGETNGSSVTPVAEESDSRKSLNAIANGDSNEGKASVSFGNNTVTTSTTDESSRKAQLQKMLAELQDQVIPLLSH